MTGQKPKAIGERVEGWSEIYPRHLGGDRYRVLSTRNDTLTVHKVNVKELSCTCKDHQYNHDKPTVCAHLAAAVYVAPKQITAEDHAVGTLIELARSGQLGVQETPAETEGSTPEIETESVNTAPDDSEEDTAATTDRDLEGACSTVTDWLKPAIQEFEHVSITPGQHHGHSGVRIEPDNLSMSDAAYAGFKGVVGSLDVIVPHVGFSDMSCNTCGKNDGEFYYFLNHQDIEEVPG